MKKKYHPIDNRSININLDLSHPLCILKNLTPLTEIKTIVTNALAKKPQGVKRDLDHHICAHVLLSYFNCTYRQLREILISNIYARYFCAMSVDTQPYNHTAYLKFANELPHSTYEKINFIFIKMAKNLSLTKINDIDVDSTVKESNITYPTDAKNLKKLMLMIWECLQYYEKCGSGKIVAFALRFKVKKSLGDFKKYFFEKDKYKKMLILRALSNRIKILVENALAAFDKIRITKIKWNIQDKIEKIKKYARVYLKQVNHYCRTNHACKDKILTFNFENITTIQKGKEHKKYEFGEVWQIGRLDGNFCFGMFNDKDLKYKDSTAIEDILEKIVLNIDTIPTTIAADRGYWSECNINAVDSLGISQQGLHPKGKQSWRVTDPDLVEKLINRRAGIEPIIGHLKRLGLGKSRMRTDRGTRAEGARSFIAFNIRKILFSFQ